MPVGEGLTGFLFFCSRFFFFFFFQKLFDLLSAAFGGPLWQAYLLQEGR